LSPVYPTLPKGVQQIYRFSKTPNSKKEEGLLQFLETEKQRFFVPPIYTSSSALKPAASAGHQRQSKGRDYPTREAFFGSSETKERQGLPPVCTSF